MKLHYIVSAIILTICSFSYGQSEKKMACGMNISNNLVNLVTANYAYNGGFSVEPVFLLKLNQYLNFKAVSGYSKISSEHIIYDINKSYQKLNYVNKGAWFKSGVYTTFKKKDQLFNNSLGISLGYAQFNESGNYIIKGAYFGDFKNNFVFKGQKVLFIETGMDLYIIRRKNFAFMVSFKLPFVIYSTIKDDFPSYYIPSYGGRTKYEDSYMSYLLNRSEFYIMIPF